MIQDGTDDIFSHYKMLISRVIYYKINITIVVYY